MITSNQTEVGGYKRLSRVLLYFISALLVLAVSIPLMVYFVLSSLVFPSEKLTAYVVQEINQRTNLHFDCEKIQMSYLNTWPSMGVTIYEGCLSIDGDSLTMNSEKKFAELSFRKLTGSIQMMKLLKDRCLNVSDLHVSHPELKVNLDQKLPSALRGMHSEHDRRRKIELDLQHIEVTEGYISLMDSTAGVKVESDRSRIVLDGILTRQDPSFNVTVSLDSLEVHSRTINQRIAFNLQGECSFCNDRKELSLGNMRFFINQFPFSIEGNLKRLANQKRWESNMRFALETIELRDFLGLFRETVNDRYRVSGRSFLQGKVSGIVGDTLLPDIWITGGISQGSLQKKGMKHGMEDIDMDVKLRFTQTDKDSCYVELHNVNLKGLNSRVRAEARIARWMDDPFITADLKGNIDFDYIGKEFIDSSAFVLKGKVDADLSTAFKLSDLQAGNFHRTWIEGTFTANRLEARSEQYHLDTFVSGTRMNFGYKKNRSDFITEAEVLTGLAEVDSMKIVVGEHMFVDLSHLRLRSNTALSKQDQVCPPVTLHMDCAALRAKLDQHTWVSGNRMEIHAGTKATTMDKQSREGAVVVKTGILHYLDYRRQQTLMIENGDFIAEGCWNPVSDGPSAWTVKGTVGFDDAKAYTTSFPVVVQSRKGRVNFQNNQILLNRLSLQIGKSDCMLSGMLATTPSALQGRSRVEGTLQLLSNTFDYDELKQTYLYGEALRKKYDRQQMLTQQVLNQALATSPKVKEEIEIESHPFYVPEGLTLNVQMDFGHMTYQQVELQQLSGNLLLKDQQALMNVSTRTNLGKADMEVYYDCRVKEHVKTSFDLKLKDILVAQMHRTIPTVTAMFPLSKSMEGLIDCRLTAEGELDNQMIPVLSTTLAVCTLGGSKLKLMDNQAFREIARKFKFKNKQNSVIEHLSANFVLQKNVVDVIPFLMEWDRYKAIIGGSHSTDFTYDYHVTMLKSPIPIDFGINVVGKEDGLHYKVGKCRYKELYKDGGVSYHRQVDEKLEKMRAVIRQHIKL